MICIFLFVYFNTIATGFICTIFVQVLFSQPAGELNDDSLERQPVKNSWSVHTYCETRDSSYVQHSREEVRVSVSTACIYCEGYQTVYRIQKTYSGCPLLCVCYLSIMPKLTTMHDKPGRVVA